MAGFVFPEVMRTMSSGEWLNVEEAESTEKIIEDMQREGILDENKGYTRELERQDSSSSESSAETNGVVANRQDDK